MAQGSKIEWTHATWNPVTGCTKVSEGCRYCYAERMSLRLQAMGKPQYRNAFQLTLHQSALQKPKSWKKPRTIFVNSMSDLFHDDVPLEFIQSVFRVMKECERHTFQVLTKRPGRVLEIAGALDWPENVWLGTSIEDKSVIHRARTLRRVPAKVRFLSIEPLLGPIPRCPLSGIQWVIVGGESGPKARPMKIEWVRQIRDQCYSKSIPFFFKQWGGTNKKKAGRVLDGKTWDQLPRGIQTV